MESEFGGISFGGINTGLPPNLVDQLIDAERIPIRNIEQKKGKEEARLDLVTQLDGGLRKSKDQLPIWREPEGSLTSS